jgi:hypothetical protein
MGKLIPSKGKKLKSQLNRNFMSVKLCVGLALLLSTTFVYELALAQSGTVIFLLKGRRVAIQHNSILMLNEGDITSPLVLVADGLSNFQKRI